MRQLDLKAEGVTSIGLYVGAEGAALVLTIRRNGRAEEVLTLRDSQPWTILAKALSIPSSKLVALYTNDRDVWRNLTPPYPAPVPDKSQQVRSWGQVRYGGNEHHWECLRALATVRFEAILVDGSLLKRARSIYDASDINYRNTITDNIAGSASCPQEGGDGNVRESVPAKTYTAEERRLAQLMLGGKNRQGTRHPASGVRRR